MPDDLPFQGKQFCCTGIERRERMVIFKQIQSMGGIVHDDLMSEVNYLVVGNRKTEKYYFSVKYRANMVFLRGDSIGQMHSKWIEGQPLTELQMSNYTLKTFEGMSMCLAHIDMTKIDLAASNSFSTVGKVADLDKEAFFDKEQLVLLVEQAGGEANTSLNLKDLIIITTDMIGRRYTKAKEWGIPAVHPLWLLDSYYRGQPLRVEDYTVGATKFLGFYEWERLREFQGAPESDLKLNRGLNSKLKAVIGSKKIKKNASVWESIMAKKNTMVESKVRDNTWADEDEDEDDQYGLQYDEIISRDEGKEADKQKDKSTENTNDNLQGLFDTFVFVLVGYNEDQKRLIKKSIVNLGGRISNNMENDVDIISHVILPSKLGSTASKMLDLLPLELRSRIKEGHIRVVTEWFLERSIYYKRICHDRWSMPIKGLYKTESPLKVCVSGFTGIELLHLEKLIEYMGFEFCPKLNSSRDILVVNVNLFRKHVSGKLFHYKHREILECPYNQNSSITTTSCRTKIKAAKNWSIPIVTIAYLWEGVTNELSVKRQTLVMPDIARLDWCLYSPPVTRLSPTKKSKFIYTSDTEHATGSEPGLNVLASPRRGNDSIIKYGKLNELGVTMTLNGGGGQGSDIELHTRKRDHENGEDDDGQNITQVGYDSVDSEKHSEQLIRKLSRKRRR